MQSRTFASKGQDLESPITGVNSFKPQDLRANTCSLQAAPQSHKSAPCPPLGALLRHHVAQGRVVLANCMALVLARVGEHMPAKKPRTLLLEAPSSKSPVGNDCPLRPTVCKPTAAAPGSHGSRCWSSTCSAFHPSGAKTRARKGTQLVQVAQFGPSEYTVKAN